MAAINTRGRRRLNHVTGPGKTKHEGIEMIDYLIEQERKFDGIGRVILPYKPREYLHGLPGPYMGMAGGASKFQKTKYEILKTLMLKEERGETGQGSWQELAKMLPIQGHGVRLSLLEDGRRIHRCRSGPLSSSLYPVNTVQAVQIVG